MPGTHVAASPLAPNFSELTVCDVRWSLDAQITTVDDAEWHIVPRHFDILMPERAMPTKRCHTAH